jgi:hypothetical protein
MTLKSCESLAGLESELHRAEIELLAASKIPRVLPGDIVTNIRQNWEYLNNNERMIFLQRFIEKINLSVTKERKNSNTARIDSIEFKKSPLSL